MFRFWVIGSAKGRLLCSAFCTVAALTVAAPAGFQTASLQNSGDFGGRWIFGHELDRSLAPSPAFAMTGRASARDLIAKQAVPIDGTGRAAMQAALKPLPIGRLFATNSIAIANARLEQRWRAVLAERADTAIIARCDPATQICDTPRHALLKAEVERLKNASLTMKVRAVNEFVNATFRYASDQSVYGVPDHWASLREFIANGRGDCEDFAITKMWMLAALGVPLQQMRIVVLRDELSQMDHAVLAVATGEGNHILDNRSRVVRDDREIKHYRPFYSMAASGEIWVHTAPVRAAESVVEVPNTAGLRASN